MSPQATRRFQLELKSASVGTQHPDINKVQNYLTRYGYLTRIISPGILDEHTSEALTTFQQVIGLEPTGTLTPETVAALELPRCGTPDLSGQAGEVRRFCRVKPTNLRRLPT